MFQNCLTLDLSCSLAVSLGPKDGYPYEAEEKKRKGNKRKEESEPAAGGDDRIPKLKVVKR